MQCVFRTNPVRRVQDDYVWYRLASSGWIEGPRSGNSPDFLEAQTLSRAFSTIRVGSSYLALKNDNGQLALVVGMLTTRQEIGQHGRPIDDTLYLLAESDEDKMALCGFAVNALVTDDAQGLANPASALGSAVDGIWAACSLKEFVLKFTGGVPEPNETITRKGSWVYPRGDQGMRRTIAQQVPALIRANDSFLVVLTDKSPGEVMKALPDYGGSYCIFSKRVEHAQEDVRPDFKRPPFPFNRTGAKIAAAVAVITMFWTIAPSCSKKQSGSSAKVQRKTVEESLKTQSCTNLQIKALNSCVTNLRELSNSELVK